VRKILIVGAGQAGLQLGLTLLANDYDVTIMSARTPQEIREGRVMSTQALFGPALRTERSHGLNLWEDEAPAMKELRVTLADPPGTPALTFTGIWDDPAQSVDQRVKMAGWLELFEERKGTVVHGSATPAELEKLAGRYDLTIVAVGRGDLATLFERDPRRSPFEQPQRALACIYLNGVTARKDHPATHIGVNVVPGVGELFSIPAYTTTGPCHIQFWEGVPGGPIDCWDDRPAPQEHLKRTLELLREYFPWEYERCADAEPTDELGTLVGRFTPVVRRPVGKLSDTAFVLGMADAVVTNDPIAGQGANNAAHCAEIYLKAILDRGDEPFDAEWMQATFDAYWDYAEHSTTLSNGLLGELPEHIQRVLGAATQHQKIANRFANSYVDPRDFTSWALDPAVSDAYVASVAEEAAS
jgi:2-polyprenyl-6-methoxyphenol hydroxylase-like FAD-dependent oxidoreductase